MSQTLDTVTEQVPSWRKEKIVPCFTPGTRIATPKGEKPVEQLRAGDRVLTRDNGIQDIQWVGHKALSTAGLAMSPNLRPILIKAGALGGNNPDRDMLVSPNHRMLVVSEIAQKLHGESEILIPARDLVKLKGVFVINVPSTTYIHFMFKSHELVLANGAWTESFQPSDFTLEAVGKKQRDEIFELFPELVSVENLQNYKPARKSLKRRESFLLWR